jgi:4'-phosphopantetheinyl transferase EntD
MSPARSEGFARGRHCAQVALRRLGVVGHAVGIGEHRDPRWPSGVIGSITHTSGFAAAVVARSGVDGVVGVGIDAEPVRAMHPDLLDDVLVPRERGRVKADPDPATAAVLCFAAKEAYFKALFPSTGQWVEFAHVEAQLVGPGRIRLVPTARGRHELPWPYVTDAVWSVRAGVAVVVTTLEAGAQVLRPWNTWRPGP